MDTTLPDLSLKKYDKVILAGMGVALLAATAAIGWGIFVILPTLLTMAENGVMLLVLIIVAFFLGLSLLELALNFQNILLHMKMTAQSIRRKVISGNPIAAIDVSIANIQAKFDEASQLSVQAKGATIALEKQIRADDKKSGAADKAENEDRLATVAQAQQRPDDEVKEHLIKSERWHRTVDTLQPLLDRQKQRQKRIDEARTQAHMKIVDLQDQKENVSIMLQAYQADAKQSKALGAFFGKGSKDMANIEIAVDEIVKQGAQAEAQIEQMLQDAEPELQAQHLQNDADAMAARARLMKGATGMATKAITEGSIVLQPLPTVKEVAVREK